MCEPVTVNVFGLLTLSGGRRCPHTSHCFCYSSTGFTMRMFHLGFITLLVLSLQSIGKISGSTMGGEFQLRLNSFRNDRRIDTYGYCCRRSSSDAAEGGDVPDSSSGSCSGSCRTFFRLCLSHYQAHIQPETTCTYGEQRTDVVGENSFTIPLRALTSSLSTSGMAADRRRSNGSSSSDALPAVSNPINIPFSYAWPGSFTVIIEAYHDMSQNGPSPGSPRQLLWRHASQHLLEAGTEWQNVTAGSSTSAAAENTSTTSSSSLSFSYRIACNTDVYGTRCATHCKPRNDRFGHYNCDPITGSRICLSGWTGEYCEKAICLPGCNNETGRCDEPNECKCKAGWEGVLCDQCIRYPGCVHGTCQQPYQCFCNEGWGGPHCDQDLNYCTTRRPPCRNGGTCRNAGRGSYVCECKPGFTGTNCELNVTDCTVNRCFNGGSCVMDTTGSVSSSAGLSDAASTSGSASPFRTRWSCRCAPGWHGTQCLSRTTDTCDDKPCHNGGACVAVATSTTTKTEDLVAETGGSTMERYKCSCPAGYSGTNCELEIDECASQPCRNGGRCIDDINGFSCVCQPGFTGTVCQTDVDDCANRPCLNGAQCVDAVNDFVCRCPPGFEGALCHINIDDCASSPCPGNSTCHDLVNGFECYCPPEVNSPLCAAQRFSSATSSADSSAKWPASGQCHSSPCQNGGTCIEQRIPLSYDATTTSGSSSSSFGSPGIFYVCHCPDDFIGSHCETRRPVTRTVLDQSSSTTLESLVQLVLIIALGVGVPLVAIIAAVVVFRIVCNRRRRKRQLQRSPIFIENATSSTSGSSNNRMVLRENQLNAAAAAAAAQKNQKLLDDSEDKVFVRYREAVPSVGGAGGGKVYGMANNRPVSSAGTGAGCSYIKLTNYHNEQQLLQQQQQKQRRSLCAQQQQHCCSHQPQQQQQQSQQQHHHNGNIYRPCSVVGGDHVHLHVANSSRDYSSSSSSSSLTSRSAVVVPLKAKNVDPRCCYHDKFDATGNRLDCGDSDDGGLSVNAADLKSVVARY